MAEKRQVPNWKDYMGQMPVNQIAAPYAAGTKTLGYKEMKSRENIAKAQLAQQAQQFALSHSLDQARLAIQQMEVNLKYMEHEANLEAAAWERDQYEKSLVDPIGVGNTDLVGLYTNQFQNDWQRNAQALTNNNAAAQKRQLLNSLGGITGSKSKLPLSNNERLTIK